jgi:2-polyprenyl-6-methoxyphenol hydroxylase-like FAD-dependent oxidoreductase
LGLVDMAAPPAACVNMPEVRMGQGPAPRPERVVVVGASLAGLFAAVAAAGAGRRVSVLERDTLPDNPVPRRGVPQGHQPHVLLYRGLVAAEELLPGLRSDLIAAGAVPFDTGDLPWLGEHGWLRAGRAQFEVVSATRPLVEHVVRERVRGTAGVTLSAGVGVERVARGGGTWVVDTSDGTRHAADLVIDASGRNTRLPAWLDELGVGPVPTTQVDARLGYATRMYAGSPGVDVPGVMVLATPQTLDGGLAVKVERDRWLVVAVGFGDRRPPRDVAGFDAFLAGLRDSALAKLVARLEPVDEVRLYRQTANRRLHVAQVRDWPEGLLVVGDALCSFNPVYGQGITVAACEALLLRRALDDGRAAARGARRLMGQFGGVQSLPWAIATGEDLRYPTCSGHRSRIQRVSERWIRQLNILAAHGNGRAQDTMGRLYHLMGSPAQLFDPRLVFAVARARVVGPGAALPRPPALDTLSGS